MKNSFPILREYLLPVLVVLLVVLIIPLVIMPQIAKIREKNQEVKVAQERLERLNAKVAELNSIDENEESLKLLEVENSVPSDKKVATLIVGVQNIASEAGLSVTEMSFKPGKVATGSATTSASKKQKKQSDNKSKAEPTDKLIFNVKLKGDLVAVAAFHKKLEKAKRLLGIGFVNSSFDETGGYSFDLEVIAPFKPIKSQGDIVSDPLPSLTDLHEAVFDLLNTFIDYTNVILPDVPTGNPDPFR